MITKAIPAMTEFFRAKPLYAIPCNLNGGRVTDERGFTGIPR